MGDLEPFFTFMAHVPPHELRRFSLRQIDAHLTWWRQAHPGEQTTGG